MPCPRRSALSRASVCEPQSASRNSRVAIVWFNVSHSSTDSHRPPSRRQPVEMRWFLVCAFAVFFLLGAMALEVARTHGSSMSPSLSDGDAVLLVKPAVLAWFGRPLKRGDVIVVRVWDQRYVKRIAALDREYIAMRNGEVVTNRLINDRLRGSSAGQEHRPARKANCDRGEPPENWHWSFVPAEITSRRYEPTSCNWGPIFVPESQFFVLGDYAAQSNDSRSFGFVAQEMIEGLVIWNITRQTTVGER